MLDVVLAVGFALFVWWFTTGIVIYLDGLPRHTYRWSMLGISALLPLALFGLYVTSTDSSVAGAYMAFTCAILVWGWHEMSFLMGYVTGPRTEALPKGTSGWSRFSMAVQAILFHELAIIVTLTGVFALTAGGENQTGAGTFIVLWLLRLSAKLNVFFGVPNLSEEFLPKGLEYLTSYFRRAPMNMFFPLSVTVSTVAFVLIVIAAMATGSGSFELISLTFIAAILGLAIIEHWLMVIPLPAAALWGWGLKSHTNKTSAVITPAAQAVVRPC